MTIPSRKSPRARVLTGAALLVTASIALVGCAAGSGGGDTKDVIRVQVQEGEVNQKVWAKLAEGYMAENPNTTVKIETISGDAKTGPNLTVVASDNAPDVALVPSNTPAYQKLIEGGSLEDLAPVWKAADLDNRYPAAVNDVTTYKGVHYVVSTGVTYYCIVYYNKDLFTKLGIPEPKNNQFASADELYAASDALKAGGVQGLAIGGGSGYIASWMLDALLPTSATADELANYNTSWKASVEQTAKYTDPAFVDALDQLKEYNDKGIYQTGFLGVDGAASEATFAAGQSGMVISGGWYPGVLAGSPVPFDVGWALLPPVNAGQKAYLSTYFDASAAIPTKAANKEGAQKFLEYILTAKAQQDAFVEIGQSSPSVNDVPASGLEKLAPMAQEMAAYAAAGGAQAGWTSLAPAGIGQALVDPLIQSMYAGQTDPKSIAQKVEDALPGVRAEN